MFAHCLGRAAPQEGLVSRVFSPRCVQVTGVAVIVLSLIAMTLLLPNYVGHAALASNGIVGGLILLALSHKMARMAQLRQQQIGQPPPAAAALLPPPPPAAAAQPPLPAESLIIQLVVADDPHLLVKCERPFRNIINPTNRTFSPLYPLLADVSVRAQGAASPLEKVPEVEFNEIAQYLTIEELSNLALVSSLVNGQVRGFRKFIFNNITAIEQRYGTCESSRAYAPQPPLRMFFNARMVIQVMRPILEMFRSQRNQTEESVQWVDRVSCLSKGTVHNFFDTFYGFLAALRGEVGQQVFAILTDGMYGKWKFTWSADSKKAVLRVAAYSIMHALVNNPGGNAWMGMRCAIDVDEDDFSHMYGPRWDAYENYQRVQRNLKDFKKIFQNDWNWTVPLAVLSENNNSQMIEAFAERSNISKEARANAMQNAFKVKNRDMIDLLCTPEFLVNNRSSLLLWLATFWDEKMVPLFAYLKGKVVVSEQEIIEGVNKASLFGRREMINLLLEQKDQPPRPLTIKERRVALKMAIDGSYSKENTEEERVIINQGRRELIPFLIGQEAPLKEWAVEYVVKRSDGGRDLKKVNFLMGALHIEGQEKEEILKRTKESLFYHRGGGHEALEEWLSETLIQD